MQSIVILTNHRSENIIADKITFVICSTSICNLISINLYCLFTVWENIVDISILELDRCICCCTWCLTSNFWDILRFLLHKIQEISNFWCFVLIFGDILFVLLYDQSPLQQWYMYQHIDMDTTKSKSMKVYTDWWLDWNKWISRYKVWARGGQTGTYLHVI